MRVRYNTTGSINLRTSTQVNGQLINHTRMKNETDKIRDIYKFLKITPQNKTMLVNIMHCMNNRMVSVTVLRISSENADGKPNAAILKAIHIEMTKITKSNIRKFIPINFPKMISLRYRGFVNNTLIEPRYRSPARATIPIHNDTNERAIEIK